MDQINFSSAVFHKFYLIYSPILCLICNSRFYGSPCMGHKNLHRSFTFPEQHFQVVVQVIYENIRYCYLSSNNHYRNSRQGLVEFAECVMCTHCWKLHNLIIQPQPTLSQRMRQNYNVQFVRQTSSWNILIFLSGLSNKSLILKYKPTIQSMIQNLCTRKTQ